jgi:cell wall-associated NlpC family hydrolase
MSFASLRSRALVTAAGVTTAIALPIGLTTVMATAATAVPETAVVSTAVAPQTAAAKAAAAQRAAVAKKKALVVARGAKIIKIAARYKGRPYRYGAAGPRAFDCSGYTSFVVRKALKVKLPRTAAQQSHSKKIKKVKKSDRKVGDLVFFHRGGGVGHVAIYAGNGKIWHSPKPGDRVKKAKIYSRSVSYGRIR